MPDRPSQFEEALNSWSDVREGLIAEAENIPAESYDVRPAPESRSVAELLRHLIETALMWSGELAREDGDFRRQGFPDFIREYAGYIDGVSDRGELIELLRSTHAEGDSRLRGAASLIADATIHAFSGTEMWRLTWLYHGIDHEMYHRGQLALYARLMGRVPALTKQIG